ncbi:MAG: hypothetical protein MUP21_02070 [Dehalococcoidia bacterium]|nr:hypothetical protein [Dehalococcoidia bacterium]
MTNETTPVPVTGCTETLDALIAVNELALFLVGRFADGVGFDDLIASWNKVQSDDEFRNRLSAAYEGWSKISGEIEDLDVNEAISLVSAQMSYVPRLMEALKQQPKK